MQVGFSRPMVAPRFGIITGYDINDNRILSKSDNSPQPQPNFPLLVPASVDPNKAGHDALQRIFTASSASAADKQEVVGLFARIFEAITQYDAIKSKNKFEP